MIHVNADLVTVEDGDTIKVRFETPLVVDSETKEAWLKGDRGVSTDAQRYEVREQAYLRLPNLDTHESYTAAGDEETAALSDWLGRAEDEYDEDEFELEVYSPCTPVFDIGEYGRTLAKVARWSDDDDWETSALVKFGNAVGWREQTPA